MRCNEYVLDIILRETGWVLQLGLLRDFILFMVPCLHLSLSYNSVKFLRARSKQTFFQSALNLCRNWTLHQISVQWMSLTTVMTLVRCLWD